MPRAFIAAIVLLQLGAACAFVAKRRYAEAVMFTGAAIANGAAAFFRSAS